MAQGRKSGALGTAAFVAVTLFLFLWAAIDGSSTIFATLVGCLVLVIWVTTRSTRKRLLARADELSQELEETRKQLYRRVTQLESQLQNLQTGTAKETVSPAMPQQQSAVDVSVEQAAAATLTTRAAALSRPVPQFVRPPVPIQPEAVQEAGTAPPPPPPFEPTAPQQVPETNITFAQIGQDRRASGIFDRFHLTLNFEELLGTNWLSKIGAAILVLGIAFGLVWKLRQVGPLGKIVASWLAGVVILGGGIFFQRKERYRTVARSAVAAGWATLFLSAYAMNHIAATRVLNSAALDMLLMLAVAAAMVMHTLRYRSQVVTGLALLLAFASINVNRVSDVYSLTAAVALVAGIAVVALRMRWYVMEICAIAVAYFNHFLWLQPIIEPMGRHRHHFPEFLPSAAILVSYWAIFRFSYLWRKGEFDERLSGAGALLNTGLLLLVLKYQSVHPEWAFWALLALGSVELALGQLPRARSRSLPHIVLTVIGACLLLTAIPFRYAPEYVSLFWLAEAEAFFMVGVLARETVFRRVGMAAFVPLIVQLISVEAARIYGARLGDLPAKDEFVPALICAFTALLTYINSHFVSRRWADQFEHVMERTALRDLSYAAGFLALTSGWMAFYFSGTAVCWMALSCALGWIGYRFQWRELQTQSALLAGVAFVRVLAVNLPMAGKAHVLHLPWSARLVTTSAVVVLCYIAALWHRRATHAWLQYAEPALTWIASTMLTLLMWYELQTASVALAWGIFALIVMEIGLLRGNVNLRLQGYVAAASAFLRLLFVNLNATSLDRLAPRLYTVVPLAILFFYFYARLQAVPRLSAIETKLKPDKIFAWLGTMAIVLLLRFEVPLDWVATAWAGVVFALMAIAWKTQKRIFLHQGIVVAIGVVMRGVLHNLYERSYFTSPSHFYSTMNTISAAALLFAALFFAFRLRYESAGKDNILAQVLGLIDARPEQLLFFLPLALVTAFLAVELRRGMVTVGWGLEAVVVFIAALWIGERSYRLAALGLLFLCIGKIAVVDFWRLGLRDRAITFTALGALIIGVSILYSRYREKVRELL